MATTTMGSRQNLNKVFYWILGAAIAIAIVMFIVTASDRYDNAATTTIEDTSGRASMDTDDTTGTGTDNTSRTGTGRTTDDGTASDVNNRE